jgi:predicted N-acetyltransferase YhbS
MRAVAPDQQGRGAGERAIRPALDAARAAGVSVHLESTNPRNLPFYERLGFARTGSLALGTGPTLIALALTP